MRGIHQWLVDSPHNRPMMWNFEGFFVVSKLLNQVNYIVIWDTIQMFLFCISLRHGRIFNEIFCLTHCGQVMHISVGKLTIIGSDNGLLPERRQAIFWTNAGILLIGPLGTNFNEILIEMQTFSLKKIRLKMSSAKCCSFRLGLNVLTV